MAHRHSNAACAEANLCLNQPRRACVTTVVAVVKSFYTNSRAASGRGTAAGGSLWSPSSGPDPPPTSHYSCEQINLSKNYQNQQNIEQLIQLNHSLPKPMCSVWGGR
jgi:hypothetical protein